MARSDLNLSVVLIWIVVISLVFSGAVVAYTTYLFSEQQKEFNDKLIFVNQNIINNLNALSEELSKELNSVQTNLTVRADLLDKSLESFRQKNNQEIIALEQLVSQIESQSNIKLDELKDDISSIQVESTDFSSIVDDVIESVVSVGTNVGQGSGVVVDERGFIITNYHVVESAALVRALMHDGKVYDATVIAINDGLDLAMLKVNANLEDLRFDDSDDVEIGQRVIALGNPAGLSFTVTEGIVSAVDRKGPNNLDIYIQTDVPINPGNSGGPLVNSAGRIIGINNFKIGGFEGLGFAIESNVVEEFSEDVIDEWEDAQSS